MAHYDSDRASLVAQRLKRLPPMRETWVRSLDREDPLEKEMAIHSSTLAWKIPWTEEPDRLHTVHGVTKSRTGLSDFTFTFPGFHPRHADDTTLMGESEEELKSLLMEMKEESEKAGLKLNIQKPQIMAFSAITSGK